MKKSLGFILFSGLVTAALFQNCSGSFESFKGRALENNLIRDQVARFAVQSSFAGSDIYRPSGGAGVNTMLISHFTTAKNGPCTNCPSWINGMTLAQVKNSLAMINGTSVHEFREIIELGRFFPAKDQVAEFDDLVAILRLYQAQNASLEISFGSPVAPWMNPELKGSYSYKPSYDESSRVCFLPVTDDAWEELKNNMSWAIGLMAKKLWEDPRLNKDWMRNRLRFDPINEFDSFSGGPNCEFVKYATGKRAASFTGGIQYVFNHYQVPFIVTMPSGATGNLQYFSDFYKYGGQAMANVHAYFHNPGKPTDSKVMITDYRDFLIRYLKEVNAVVPAPYKNNLILGEFGNYLTPSKHCPLGGPSLCKEQGLIITGEALKTYWVELLTNQEIRAVAPVRMIWRLVDATEQFAKPTYDLPYMTSGAITSDLVPKASLYHYLLNEGVDLSRDKVRSKSLRQRVSSALQARHQAYASETDIDAFIRDLIYQPDSWDDLLNKYGGSPSPVDPCAGPAGTQICSAYQALYGRTPDQGSVDYWKSQLTSDGNTPRSGFPMSCWKHQIIKGTKQGDCATYMQKFAPVDSFGRRYGWVPSAGCPLPTVVGQQLSNHYSPACFVFPADAETPCPGSPDPGGTVTLTQKNLCRAYSELFRREPDPAGFEYWLSELNGKSLACIKKALVPATNAADCAAFRAQFGVNANSAACGGTESMTFGCRE